jgi:hypothetical protein
MIWLRVLIGALIALAIAIAVVPLAVLADLKDGGSGWGLCPQGLAVCRNGYFAGFELITGVVVALGAVLLAIHLCVRALRRLERQQSARAFITSQQAAWLRQQQAWQQREGTWAAQSGIPGQPASGAATAPAASRTSADRVATTDPGR